MLRRQERFDLGAQLGVALARAIEVLLAPRRVAGQRLAEDLHDLRAGWSHGSNFEVQPR